MRSLFVMLTMLLLFSCSPEREKSSPVMTEKSTYEALKDRIAADPKDEDAWSRLADQYDRVQMYGEEVDALKKVVALNPHAGYSYFKLGTAYNRLGRYDDAIVSFNTAKRYIPRNPVLYNNLAFAYGKVGKIDREIESLKKALSLRPTYVTARFNLGIVYLRKGDRAEAMKQYAIIKERDEGAAASLKKEIDAKRR
jgi:tetratricopeptide (TPR) repeat protein